MFWAGNLGEAGQVLHGYQSAWLPASLLQKDQQDSLGDALFAATRHWSVSLHVNKGLAGAPAEAIDAARDTATNPAVLDAFALAISGAEGPPAYPGVPGHEPDLAAARAARRPRSTEAMGEVRKLLPNARLVRRREQLLRRGLAGSVLGSELRPAARGEGQVRPGRPLRRAPRRGQRALERRRLHEVDLTSRRNDQDRPRPSALSAATSIRVVSRFEFPRSTHAGLRPPFASIEPGAAASVGSGLSEQRKRRLIPSVGSSDGHSAPHATLCGQALSVRR